MTTAAQTPRKQYTATASQTTFAYDFHIPAEGDELVLRTRAGVTTTLVLGGGNDYTLTGVGNEAGGDVVLNTGADEDDIITILRNESFSRVTDFSTGGDFFAANVNAQLDKLTRLLQQVSEQAGRAITLAEETTVSTPIEFPEATADYVIAWNAGGTALASRDANDLVDASALATAVAALINSDDITEGSTQLFLTAAEQTKLGYLSVTQAVDLDQIEADIAALDSAMVLQGSWDASAGTFPGGGTAQAGDSYIVSIGGTVDSVVFTANDRIVAITDNASTSTYASNWHKLDYTDAVLSVAGKTGAVTLAAGDIVADTFADARIAESNVTQHEAAIDHDALTNFVAAEHIDWSVTGAEVVHDDRVAESSVTQHEAALSITESQISDLGSYLVASNNLSDVGAAATAFGNIKQAASASATGVVELATLAEANAGTDTGRVITPDVLAGCYAGGKTISMLVVEPNEAVTTGDNKNKIHAYITADMGGMNLVSVFAEVGTAGTTGTQDMQIHNITQAADMLSTVMTIDSGETDTSTAATPAVIDIDNDDVAAGDLLRIDIDAVHTTPAQGPLMVVMDFKLP